MSSSDQTSNAAAGSPQTVLGLEAAGTTVDSNANTENHERRTFRKSESHAMGITGKLKSMCTGKNLVTTVMTMGFLFTWSERALTYFRTGFSLYRDIPRMITGTNLDGIGRLGLLKSAGQNTKKLFEANSDNNFLKQYTMGEKLEAAATLGGVMQNAWFLFSSRQAHIPEGDTWLGKVKSVLKDPKRHAAQMASICMAVVIGMLSTGRVMTGINNLSRNAQGNWIGFHPGQALTGHDAIYKAEKLMPLIAGGILLISAPLSLYGLLNIKKTSQQKESLSVDNDSHANTNEAITEVDAKSELKTFAQSRSTIQSPGSNNQLKEIITMFAPGNLKDAWAYAKERAPLDVVGRVMAFGLDIGSFGVGLARLSKIESGKYAHEFGPINSPQWNAALANAKQMRNVGILGFFLTGLYSVYVYDSLMHNNKKEQQEAKNNVQMAR